MPNRFRHIAQLHNDHSLRRGTMLRGRPSGGNCDVDINTVTEVVRQPPDDRPGSLWRPGDAWLAGGTWLFSDTQPDLRRLIDLMPLGWNSLVATARASTSARCAPSATSTRSTAPADWPAAALLPTSCEAFLASFKVWNSATVGGNICMSLPAGPMITLTVALEATYTLWCRRRRRTHGRRSRFRHRQPRERPRAGRVAAPHPHSRQRAAQAPRPPPLHPHARWAARRSS